MLQIAGLSCAFGGNLAVDSLSFELKPARLTGLVGANGAGKTTCFNMISGYVTPTAGTILLEQQDITSLRPDQRSRLGLARTFQSTNVFGRLTVGENVKIARHAFRARIGRDGVRVKSALHDDDRHVRDVLTRVDLARLAHVPAADLAYGQLRRLGVAIALATEPKVLLLDEPAAGLNSMESNSLGRLFRDLCDAGIAVLLVEHDMDLVMNYCHEVLIMDAGKLLASGTPSDIRQNQKVIDAYLGSSGGGPDQPHS